MHFGSFASFETRLDTAIDNCMQADIADKAKKALQESIDENVYDAYPDPIFNHRRKNKGGIRDKANMDQDYNSAGKELTITEAAGWQHLRGGTYPSSDLGDVIENNKIYHAPARPFAAKAETEYGGSHFESDLVDAMIKRGF